jgi:hypothetical protein
LASHSPRWTTSFFHWKGEKPSRRVIVRPFGNDRKVRPGGANHRLESPVEFELVREERFEDSQGGVGFLRVE